jgi:peptidoglycan hydrolase-like protein with peptidoglycan-binding domain
VLSRSNVPRVERVNFSISVGTAVPTHVHIVEVPPILIEIHPEWRGHRYFVVDEDIIIVDRSREIVAVLPAGPSQAAVGGGTTTISVDLSPEEIREVQLVLIERGFLDGEPDGILGPNTRQALIQFQRREGIQVTGRIDRRTVTTLNLSGKIRLRDGNGASDREPSTVGEGRSRDGMRQEPQRQQDSRQPSGSQDMDRDRPGQPQKGSEGPQNRSTTGQGGNEPPKSSQGMQPGRNPDRESTGTGTGSSTTGQGSGEQQPNASQRMQPGQNGGSKSPQR